MDKEWLAVQLGQGRSIESIARETGRSASTVGYWVKKHGLQSAHAERHANRGGIDRDALASMVAEGWSIRSMAGELGLSYATVRHWLLRYGLMTDRARRMAATREARAAGVAEVLLECPAHGLQRHVRRNDGAIRCAVCRTEAVTFRRQALKAVLVREHGGRCRICGYGRTFEALQFHHVDPAGKGFAIGSGASLSLEALRREAAKCVLLCATCHAEIEAGHVELPLATSASQAREAPAGGG